MVTEKVMQKLAIIIPARNEATRITKTLNEYSKYYDKLAKYNTTLVIVSNGCTDNTNEVVQAFIDDQPELAIDFHVDIPTKGKGEALKYGIAHAPDADWYYISDADYSSPWTVLGNFLMKAKIVGADCVIGTRASKEAEVINSPIRSFLGTFGNKLIRFVLGLPFNDTQSGYKLFSASCKEALLKAQDNRWAYDFEVLYLLQKDGKKIVDHPIEWKEASGSKVTAKSYFQTLVELLKIRFRW